VLKRLRWLLMGMSVGASASVWAQRRLRRWLRSYTPPEVATRAAQRTTAAAERTADDVRTAVAEGRQAMRQREAELRAEVERRTNRP
jgi:hypothetical protein